jgi:hypothetical protein
LSKTQFGELRTLPESAAASLSAVQPFQPLMWFHSSRLRQEARVAPVYAPAQAVCAEYHEFEAEMGM